MFDTVIQACRLADFAQALLERSPVFEVMSPRQLSVLCFRYRPPQLALGENELDRLNLELVEALWATNRAKVATGWQSANNGVDPSVYTDPVDALSAKYLTDPKATFRFDASDLMPSAMNAAFWTSRGEWS